MTRGEPVSLTTNPTLLLQAFKRSVTGLFTGDTGNVKALAWLKELQGLALLGLNAGDTGAALSELQGWISTSVSSGGHSTAWLCSLNATQVAELAEATIQTLEREATEVHGSTAYGGFGGRISELG